MKSLEIVLAIVLSIGAVQGVVYGCVLCVNNKGNKLANRFLATILFFFSYRLFVEVIKLFGVGFYDFWYHVLLEYNWIYGALIFFFVKASVTQNFKFRLNNNWIHFLPVLIEFTWSNFIKTQNFYWDGTRESLSWLGYWGYVVWMHYPTMYIICALLIIYYTQKSKRLIVEAISSDALVGENQVNWISNVLKVLQYFSIIVVVIVLTDFIFFDYAFNKYYEYPIFLILAIITYGLGLKGFAKRNDVLFKTKIVLTKKEEEQLQTIAQKLNSLMNDEQLFKDSSLTLRSLSDHLGIKSYLITKCLNHVFEKKFNDYINELRIEELKRLLKDPKNQNFTLLNLAFESGFNSKASFNRAVIKLTGKSPKHLKPGV